MGEFSRPLLPGPQAFTDLAGAPDPAEASAAGHRIAHLLVRGSEGREDSAVLERLVQLVDTEGIGLVADLWADAPADSVAGCLWRLYLLHTWVHTSPTVAAHEFAAGKAHTPVQEVLAGVADPPSPGDVLDLVDTVIRGVLGVSFDVALERAASFAHVTAVGRSQLNGSDVGSAARLFDLAQQLHQAAALERAGKLA